MTDTKAEVPEFPMLRDPEHPLDPPPILAQMQAGAGVCPAKMWNGTTPWIVTRFADLQQMLSDQRLSVNAELPGYPAFTPAIHARQQRVQTFINLDDPEHNRQRRMLTPTVTVKHIQELRPRVQKIVDDLIDDMLAGPKPADLVESFALPMPSLVICELLGVPYEDRELFQKAGSAVNSKASSYEEGLELMEQMLEYIGELVDAKNADPNLDPEQDLLSELVVRQLREGKLSRDQVVAMAELVLVAGHDTTANQTALSVLALLLHPEQLAELRDTDDPDLVSNAVEELLRYLNITHGGRRRIALEDLTIGDQLVRKGDGVIGANDIGNRDPSVFENPNTLDIHRSNARKHMAFGYGIHQCFGQQLARMELTVVYTTLFRRIPTLQLAVGLDEINFKFGGPVYGVWELPVTW
ncbi:MAG: cytochrome P450 [Actinomycetota bacterium]|nr:MAG: cytochrome P450 [Actinomycetota bacterium]